VVGNVKTASRGEEFTPVLYRSLQQNIGAEPSLLGYTLVVHTAGHPAAMGKTFPTGACVRTWQIPEISRSLHYIRRFPGHGSFYLPSALNERVTYLTGSSLVLLHD
jgi:hypothetical protein